MSGTWVLLRGLMRESRHWGEFPALFAAQVPGARLVAPDLPGNGRLHGMASPTRMEDAADWLRLELRRRGCAPPYHLLALSLGAMVAVAWGARYPEELGGAVLINTSLRPFSPFYRRLRPRTYPQLLRYALMDGDAQAQEQLILQLTSSRPAAATGVLEDWIAWRREYPVSRANALRQLVAAGRYRAPETKPVFPALVLAGAQDRLVDPRCSGRLVARWGASFALHPAAGHDLPLDDGPWVARQVRQWLDSRSEEPRSGSADPGAICGRP